METLILIVAINIGVVLFLVMTRSERNIESRTEREEKLLREKSIKEGK